MLPTRLIKQLKYVAANSAYYRKVFEKLNVKISKEMTSEEFSKIPITSANRIRKQVVGDPERFYCIHDEPYWDHTPLEIVPSFAIRLLQPDIHLLSYIQRDIFENFGLRSGRMLMDLGRFGMSKLLYSITPAATLLPLPFYISDILDLRIVENMGLPAPSTINRGKYILGSFKTQYAVIDKRFLSMYEKSLADNKLTFGKLGVKHLVSLSELSLGIRPYSLNGEREFIKRQGVKKLSNLLQAAEPLFLSPECRDGLYHIFEDYYFVEVVDPETETSLPLGETGKITATNLFAKGSPFVRYSTPISAKLVQEKCSLSLNTTIHLDFRV